MEDFVENHLCKLCVILRPRVLRGVYTLMDGMNGLVTPFGTAIATDTSVQFWFVFHCRNCVRVYSNKTSNPRETILARSNAADYCLVQTSAYYVLGSVARPRSIVTAGMHTRLPPSQVVYAISAA